MCFKNIWKFFSKGKKETNMSDSPNTPEKIAQEKPKAKRKHKFEIQIYEADYEKADANNGQPEWRLVRGDPKLDGGRPMVIEVANKEEFREIQQQYALCDQQIRIVREIDPFVDDEEDASKQVPAASIPQNNQAIPVKQPDSQPMRQTQASQPIVQQATKPKPKIVTIGDVEIKYDGDKVYHKQWIALTPNEARNFRIVADSSNKLVSMNGKHIEAKRWVLVEEKSDDASDAVENLIEG